MRTRLRGAIAAATALAAAIAFSPISGQAPVTPVRTGQPAAAPRAARIAGHPNLNGIYQAIGSQFWNLEDHPAKATPLSSRTPASTIRPGSIGREISTAMR